MFSGAVQQTQTNPKYNKNTTLITILSSLYIGGHHEVPKEKEKREF